MEDHQDIKQISTAAFSYTPKKEQLEAVSSYYKDGNDTILIAPTGFGKSYIYQIAPFLYDKRYGTHDRPIPSSTPREEESFHSDISTDFSAISSSTSMTLSRNLPLLQPPFQCVTDSAAQQGAEVVASSTPVRPPRHGIFTAPEQDDVDMSNLSSLFQETSITSSIRKTTTSAANKVVIQFIIIMPLIAMITDGLANLRKHVPQVSAVHMTAATMSEASVASLVFASPETLLSDCGRRFLRQAANIMAVFVDEFHIVSAWGLSDGEATAFRDCYGRLGELRAYLKDVPFICMSATATEAVVTSVTSSLRLLSPNIIRVQVNKPNICYHRVGVKGSVITDFNWLIEMVRSTAAETIPRTLIFFRNTNTLIDAFNYVTAHSNGRDSCLAMFHLNTDAVIKREILTDLTIGDGKFRIIFCTSSLSMGMNLSMIRYVIHFGPPITTDAFFQQTGRAGRERDLVCHSILMTNSRMFSGLKPDPVIDLYAKSETGCLRVILLSYFNSEKPADQPHCCMRCHPDTECQYMDLINKNYDSPPTEDESDSDSVASVASVESLPEI